MFEVPIVVGDFYRAVFCWLNWTANQSCFSPLSLFFHLATERGRYPVQFKKTCLLQIFVAELSKTGRNMISKGFKPAAFLSSPVCAPFHCSSHCLLIVLSIIKLEFYFICMPFGNIVIYYYGQRNLYFCFRQILMQMKISL